MSVGTSYLTFFFRFFFTYWFSSHSALVVLCWCCCCLSWLASTTDDRILSEFQLLIALLSKWLHKTKFNKNNKNKWGVVRGHTCRTPTTSWSIGGPHSPVGAHSRTARAPFIQLPLIDLIAIFSCCCWLPHLKHIYGCPWTETMSLPHINRQTLWPAEANEEFV